MFNNRSLREKKFHSVMDTEKAKAHPELAYWRNILGDMEGRCKIMVYGRSGSGKSVLVLRLAQFLSQIYGKAAYNSWEERVNKTLKLRVENFDITSPTLWFLDSNDYEELCTRIEKLYLRIVVIDSVQYAKFTKDQLLDIERRFAKRHIIYILVSFGTVEFKTRGADDLLHACDIKIYVSRGKAHVTNRYLHKKAIIELFDEELSIEQPEPDEVAPDLFTPNSPQDETAHTQA
jgi:GTPase SAR1 family protein